MKAAAALHQTVCRLPKSFALHDHCAVTALLCTDMHPGGTGFCA
jgi:hypothetical protein